MRVIICGAGQVGTGIARQLAAENNDVTVIDRSADLIQSIQETLDVRGIVGHGSHPNVLDRAGAGQSDMLIAVTFADEINMIACQVAHSLFSVPLKVARVRAQPYLRPEWQDLFSRENMPIDVIISPELEVGKSVLRRLEVPGAFETIEFADGRIQFIGVRIEKDSPVINTQLKQLSELFPGVKSTVVAIWRRNHLFVPSSSDQVMAEDDLYFIADRNHVARTLDIFGHQEQEARRVLIVGAGNIGVYTARELEKRHASVKTRVIEYNKAKAEAAADQLERTVVLHGSGLDQALLREAGVQETETVISLTNNDEVNVLASVIAKTLGARKTIALINNQEYGRLLEPLGVDAFIDPKTTTVSTILRHVRRGRIKGLYSIRGGQGEVIDAVALETSPLVGKPLRSANLPDGVIVGAILRGRTVITPRGDDQINAGDRVILFAQHDVVRKVEQMFRVSLEYF
ncbi:MAG: Trk system potassium transporter TrkA [Alphaproteobacteria bacterium]